MDMSKELEAVLGRKVNLVEKHLIEQSDNYIRRKQGAAGRADGG
jgi:hypothetical protein